MLLVVIGRRRKRAPGRRGSEFAPELAPVFRSNMCARLRSSRMASSSPIRTANRSRVRNRMAEPSDRDDNLEFASDPFVNLHRGQDGLRFARVTQRYVVCR